MATNKNQHFVPRCLLKPFTRDEQGTDICLFNLDRQKLIPGAPVKNQCSGDYFYGQNELLETAIQHLEGDYSRVLKEIRSPKYSLTPENRLVLARFWLLQQRRTEAASQRSVEMMQSQDESIGEKAFSFNFDIRESVLMAMRDFAEIMDVIDDLKFCLLRNRTKTPFITSDDPAVMTNRWYFECPKIHGRSFGLHSSGMLAFLPLTPKIICVAYDGDVYSVPHDRSWCDVKVESDARALNQFQFLNCFANVYVHDKGLSETIKEQYLNCRENRLEVRHALHHAIKDKEIGDHVRYKIVSAAEARQGH